MASLKIPSYKLAIQKLTQLSGAQDRLLPQRQLCGSQPRQVIQIKKIRTLLQLLLAFSLLALNQVSAQSANQVTKSPGSQASIQKQVRGSVTDVNNLPLMGVQIQTVPAGSQTIYTDSKGNFSLSINLNFKKLVFTKNGYIKKTLSIKDISRPILVQLSPADKTDSLTQVAPTDNQALNEVVIIGYGAKKSQRKAAGKASKNNIITFGQLPVPSSNINMALQGRVAGLYTNKGRAQQILYGYRNPAPDNETYAHIKESGFKATYSNPLSTFSIDVDKASYSNVRRFIEQGNLPDADAVRIEELINYFDYQYPQPGGQDPVAILTELSQAPWNPDHYLLQVGLQAKKVPTDQLPPSNLVFLIDVSGSMGSPDKLPLLVSAFKMLTDQLRAEDHVSIVTYAGYAQNVLNPTRGDHKQRIKAALDGLVASGSTNGAGGLEKAYNMAEKHFSKKGNNRIILASDGDFNVGASSLQDLETLITEKRNSGIFLSVLGFGMGNYKDDKMELLADKGNGNYAYIDNSAEARRVLLKEFGGTLFTIAKDVKVQVEFNPRIVEAYRLIGYENRALADEDFNQDTVDAGEMGSGSTVTALYEIIPKGSKDKYTPKVDDLRYGPALNPFVQTATSKNMELGLIKIRYKEPQGQKSKLITKVVQDIIQPLTTTSGRFQLAAAAASWGMLLKNSDFKQGASYDEVEKLIQKPLSEDKTGQIGQFLTLVKTSQALIGNEVNVNGRQNSPVIHPRQYLIPRRRSIPQKQLKKSPPVVKILPVQAAATTNSKDLTTGSQPSK